MFSKIVPQSKHINFLAPEMLFSCEENLVERTKYINFAIPKKAMEQPFKPL